MMAAARPALLFSPLICRMKSRNALAPLLLLALFFIAFLVRRWNEPQPKEVFNRQPAALIYTRHALCRMDCRHISKQEVRAILENGIILFHQSNKAAQPCPTFALQGITGSGESIRVIFAQCSTQTRVITCYNLKKDFVCKCPGDKK